MRNAASLPGPVRFRPWMNHRLIPILLLALASLAAAAQQPTAAPQERTARSMTLHAHGSFDVKNTPLAADEATAGTAIGRFALDKQYHGDLEGAAKGEMLGSGNPGTGTAGYVALEQVTGTLNGRTGGFALQHFGTMEGGNFELKILVVPGSGTGEFAGIAGSATFTIAAGKHTYTLDYTLPEGK